MLSKSSWIIHGFNLVIVQTDLVQATISLDNECPTCRSKFVNISKSTFGQIKASDVSNIIISECNIDGTKRLKTTLLDLVNCNINILESNFYNNKGAPALLIAVSSHVTFNDIVMENNIGEDGLIKVSNSSQLYVNNSRFQNNGGSHVSVAIISAKFNSLVVVEKSEFYRNEAAKGSCLSAFQNTTVIVKKSIFESNSALYGGALFCSKGNVSGKNMHVNQDGKGRTVCILHYCQFINNIANLSGGALYFYNAHGNIFTSRFLNNTALQTGGSMTACYLSAINITSCNFTTSMVLHYGALIYIEENVNLILNNTYFHNNFATSETMSSIWASNHCRMSINECYFTSLKKFSKNILLTITNSTKITVTNSIFQIEEFMTLHASDACHGHFRNCSFLRFNALILATRQIIISIEDSTLEGCWFCETAIIIRNKCIINITGTSITDSTYSGPFISAQSQSSVLMHDCLYARNNRHFHLVSTDHSTLTITQCQFSNNSLTLFNVTQGIVSIQDSLFRRNRASENTIVYAFDSYLELSDSILDKNQVQSYHHGLITTYSSNVSLYNCSFANNGVQCGILVLESRVKTTGNYGRIKSCKFVNSTRNLIRAENMSDISLQSSEFHLEFCDLFGSGINIFNTPSVRIADSFFNFSYGCQIDFESYFSQYVTIQLLSFKSNFSNGDYMIATGTEDFVKEAKSLGFLQVSQFVTLEQQDTVWASGTITLTTFTGHR